MKKPLFLSLVLIAWCPSVTAQRYSDKDVTIETWEAGDDYFPTIAPGRMVFRSLTVVGKEIGFYTYKSNAGREVVLSGQIDSVNLLLDEQVPTAKIPSFLTATLSKLVAATMGATPASVIEIGHVRGYEAEHRPELAKRLGEYVTRTFEPVVTSARWQLEFNVMSDEGGVEHWAVSGTVAPFHIDSFNRRMLVRDGTFPHLLQTRGGGKK